MYQIGDIILYGDTGVCRIQNIISRKSPNGKDKDFYQIQPLYQQCAIYSPVDNTKVFMRPVISKEEADKLIDEIPSMETKEYHKGPVKDKVGRYEAALKTHNCSDLIDMTMSMYAKRENLREQKKKFGTVDERFMKRAEDLLFGEFSVALGIPKDQVPEYIAERVGKIKERV